jgi:hypothetical protein
MMSDKTLPVEHWGWPKLIFFPSLLFGAWSALAVFTPHYSPGALVIGIILTLFGVTGAILVSKRYRRAGQLAFSNAFLLIFLTISGRSWRVVIGNDLIWGIWMSILLVIYILAWFLPSLNPDLSAFLWREQYTPETSVGKAFLNISARFLPISGAVGALFGMYATRAGQDQFGMLFMGVAFALLSIALAQLGAHQFWMEDHLPEDTAGEEG